MKKKTIIISFIVVLLIFISTIAVTYSAVIEVVSEDGIDKIVNDLTLKDLVTDSNNTFNKTYYDVKNTLNITNEEMDILINSTSLNNSLKTVINSIVDYKLHNKNKLSSDEIYNLIVMSVNEDNNIPQDLKNKVINKSAYYKYDISKFIYDIDINLTTNN